MHSAMQGDGTGTSESKGPEEEKRRPRAVNMVTAQSGRKRQEDTKWEKEPLSEHAGFCRSSMKWYNINFHITWKI